MLLRSYRQRARRQAKPARASLDAAVAAKDYRRLGQIILSPANHAALTTSLDWSKAAMLRGETSFVAMLYAGDPRRPCGEDHRTLTRNFARARRTIRRSEDRNRDRLWRLGPG